MRGHYAVGVRWARHDDAAQAGDREKNIYGSHGKVAARGAPTRASHALFPSPYFLKKRVNGGREIVCHSGEQDARMIPGYS